MYSYNVAKSVDKEAFNKACADIESQFRDIEKEKLLVDVDGTQIQIYSKGSSRIKVYNDYEVDAVYVDSEISLSSIF